MCRIIKVKKIRKRGRWDRGKEEIDDCVDIQQQYIKTIGQITK